MLCSPPSWANNGLAESTTALLTWNHRRYPVGGVRSLRARAAMTHPVPDSAAALLTTKSSLRIMISPHRGVDKHLFPKCRLNHACVGLWRQSDRRGAPPP